MGTTYSILLTDENVHEVRLGPFLNQGRPDCVLRQRVLTWPCPHIGCNQQIVIEPAQGVPQGRFVEAILNGRPCKMTCACGSDHNVSRGVIRQARTARL